MRSSLDATAATVVDASLVRVPRTIAPPQTVQTAGELTAVRRRRAAATAAAAARSDLPPAAMATAPAIDPVVPPSANPSLIAAAQQRGESLVSADHPTTVRTVEAEAGDTLATLAERAYGTNTRSARQALVAANPSLRSDPGHIVAGRAYAVAVAKPSAAAAEAPTAGTSVYVVQSGDSLWSIAANQVGSTSAVAAIRDLNRDALHGDRVRAGMKLRLPARGAQNAERRTQTEGRAD